MKRISRLKKPLGLRRTASQRPAASQSLQSAVIRAPLSTCSSSTRGTMLVAPNASLRFYSSQKSTPLPASLTNSDTTTSSRSTTDLAEQESVFDGEAQRDLVGEAPLDAVSEVNQLAFRPPPKLRRAQTPDQISDPAYVPATTSDELETVGGLENWWNRRENWPKTSDFEGFKAHRKVHDQNVLELVARRAFIEATVLRTVGREDELLAAWPVPNNADAIERCLGLDIEVNNGDAVIIGDLTAVAEDLTWKPADVVETEEVLAQDGEGSAEVGIRAAKLPLAAQAAEYVGNWSSRWKDAPLTDPRIKFAIRKRIFQLTGQLIPDHQLSNIKNVKTLLAILQKPEKPKTLSVEILKTKRDLIDLPNVAFAPNRVTRGDKAKALGQFKLIEAEFAKREIQNVHAVSSREKAWFKGAA